MLSKGKRIPIDELRNGMFVAGVFDNRSAFLYSARTLINDVRRINYLKRSGATYVVVLVDEDVPPPPSPVTRSREVEELSVAQAPVIAGIIAAESSQQSGPGSATVNGSLDPAPYRINPSHFFGIMAG